MYAKQPKKLMILNILDILRKYTDEDHRLSQKEISDILKSEYQMPADRKAVRRNLLNLMDCGYDIEYSELVRMVPNPKTKELEESYLWSDFYLERQFTDGELRLLIDGLLFSQHVPYSQCKELVEKLEGLSSIYFRSRVGHIAKMPADQADNIESVCDPDLGEGHYFKDGWIWYLPHNTGSDSYQHIDNFEEDLEKLAREYWEAAADGEEFQYRNGIFLNIQAIIDLEDTKTGETET